MISSNSRAGVNNPSFLPQLGGNSPRNFQYAWTQPWEPLSAHPAQLSERTARISSPSNNTWCVLDSRVLHLASLSLAAEQILNCGRWRGICCMLCAPRCTSCRCPADNLTPPAGWVHRGAPVTSDTMELKVWCVLLFFTFYVQEGLTRNYEADLGSKLLLQVRTLFCFNNFKTNDQQTPLNQELYHIFKWWNKNKLTGSDVDCK